MFGAHQTFNQTRSPCHLLDILFFPTPAQFAFNMQQVSLCTATLTQPCTSHESIYTRPCLINSSKPGEQELMFCNMQRGSESWKFMWYTSSISRVSSLWGVALIMISWLNNDLELSSNISHHQTLTWTKIYGISHNLTREKCFGYSHIPHKGYCPTHFYTESWILRQRILWWGQSKQPAPSSGWALKTLCSKDFTAFMQEV